MSPEQIEIKENYCSKDIDDTEHIGFISGIAPNLRGPYASMYVYVLGLLDSMQASQLPKNRMPFTEET